MRLVECRARPQLSSSALTNDADGPTETASTPSAFDITPFVTPGSYA